MPVIHLVRHSQASFGADDYDKLSDLGSEAEVVGEVLTDAACATRSSSAAPSTGNVTRPPS